MQELGRVAHACGVGADREVVAVAHEVLGDRRGCPAARSPSTAAGSSPMCLATAGRRRSRSTSTVRTSGWCARLKARLSADRGLAAAAGRRGDAERGPAVLAAWSAASWCASCRRWCAPGRRRSKVTMRLRAHQPRVGLEGRELGPGRARPAAARGRRGRAPAPAAPRRGGDASPRCSLAFWMAAWMRSITSSLLVCRPAPAVWSRGRRGRPPPAPAAADQQVERHVVGVDREERERDADDDQRQHHQRSACACSAARRWVRM